MNPADWDPNMIGPGRTFDDAFDELAGRLAPIQDPPPGTSRYVPLPLLDRCAECKEPVSELELMAVYVDGNYAEHLCRRCAARLAWDWSVAT